MSDPMVDALTNAFDDLNLVTNRPAMPAGPRGIDPLQVFLALAPPTLIARNDANAKLFAAGYERREIDMSHVDDELRDDLSNEYYDDPRCAAIRFEAFNVVQHVAEMLANCEPIVADSKPRMAVPKGNVTTVTFSNFRNVGEKVANFIPVVVVASEGLYTPKKSLVGRHYSGEVFGCAGELIVKLETTKPKFFDPSLSYHVFIKPFETTYNAISDVTKALENGKGVVSKIFGKREFGMSRETFIKHRTSDMKYDIPCRIEKFLNKAQRDAVYSMQMQDSANVFLLFGPPGTGKTTTLIEGLRSLIKHPQSDKPPKFLVCTPSNMAADNFALALIKSRAVEKKKILRVLASRYEFSMIDPDIKDIVYTFNNMLALPERETLLEYDVIVSTIGCSQKLRRCGSKHFTHIIIDEAGQATEPETLVPLVLLSGSNTRIIMAGDPKQLGPVIVNNILSEAAYKFDESLLMRLSEKKEYKEDPRLMIQLTDNHRSHEVIVTAASEIIYDGTLVHTCPDGHDSFMKHSVLDSSYWPLRFHAVFGEEAGGDSRFNLAEVDVVVRYVQKLLRETPDLDPSEIGIISPYKEQGRRLTTALRNYDGITIDTVEKFQGSERRVIIMSTIRTRGLGFVDEIRRFNTAITRARELLIVVGHPNALIKSEFWKVFMHFCATNDCFHADSKLDKDVWVGYFHGQRVAYPEEPPNNNNTAKSSAVTYTATASHTCANAVAKTSTASTSETAAEYHPYDGMMDGPRNNVYRQNHKARSEALYQQYLSHQAEPVATVQAQGDASRAMASQNVSPSEYAARDYFYVQNRRAEKVPDAPPAPVNNHRLDYSGSSSGNQNRENYPPTNIYREAHKKGSNYTNNQNPLGFNNVDQRKNGSFNSVASSVPSNASPISRQAFPHGLTPPDNTNLVEVEYDDDDFMDAEDNYDLY
uniref:RNA helicase n=1 Tax=Panagrellus redivivus TaxID=6233 RepID=A0A7E4VEQ3_PANRE